MCVCVCVCISVSSTKDAHCVEKATTNLPVFLCQKLGKWRPTSLLRASGSAKYSNVIHELVYYRLSENKIKYHILYFKIQILH